jgi:hypothetical protein
MADGDGEALAAKLPASVTGETAAFEAKLAACRDIYLKDGLVSVEQVRETLILIRAHLPLPVTARVPRPEDLVRGLIRPEAR